MCQNNCGGSNSTTNTPSSDTTSESNILSLTGEFSPTLHNCWFWIALVITIAFVVSRKK